MHFTDGRFRLASLATAAIILVAACSSSGASSSPAASAAAPSAAPSAAAPSSAASVAPSAAAGDPNDLLAKIKAAGVIRVGTDPTYPPQSELKPDGTFEGFDIDTANEIAKRLGVKVKFETPDFSVVEAGKWAGRFDVSVGSVTITKKRARQPRLHRPVLLHAGPDDRHHGVRASRPSRGSPARPSASVRATTYFQWINGELTLGDGSALAPVPAGMKATTLKTDQSTARCRSSPAARTSMAG